MAKKKKKSNEFEILSEKQEKKLQDLANEMIGIASNVIEEYEDLDIEIFDNLSGSLDSLNQITQIHEDSPFLNEIFEGKRKCNYTLPMLKKRMVEDGYAKEECYSCGWNEGRVTDGKIPLTIDFIDGESENKSLENMRLLCPNCYFVNNGFFHNSKKFVK